MTPRLKVMLSLLTLLVITSLASYMLANTSVELNGLGQEGGSLRVETDLPNATCQKVLKRSFPFVAFVCTEKVEQEQLQP